MNQEILNKAAELINFTNGKICNHCLGRKFSDCVEGNGNEERGIKIRQALKLESYNDEECEISCRSGGPHVERRAAEPVP